MKRAYDIKINDLKELLQILYDNSNDSMVLRDAIRLENYIKRLENNFCTEDSSSLLERMAGDIQLLPFYKPFYPFIERFLNTGVNPCDFDTEITYKTIRLSDRQIVSDTQAFFATQGESIYKNYCDFIEEASDHLRFISPRTNTDGETISLKSIGESYVFSPNYSDITKFTILVHEIQHVIDFYINPDFSDYYIIRECIAIFRELIACDFIADKYNLKDENYKRQYVIHATIKCQAYNLGYKMEILNIINKNRSLNSSELLKLLEKKGFDKEDVEFYFEEDISTNYVYQIAYLIALELYSLYKVDKEKCFLVVEDIINNGNPINILSLLSEYGISLNNSVDTYEKKLLKKIKGIS